MSTTLFFLSLSELSRVLSVILSSLLLYDFLSVSIGWGSSSDMDDVSDVCRISLDGELPSRERVSLSCISLSPLRLVLLVCVQRKLSMLVLLFLLFFQCLSLVYIISRLTPFVPTDVYLIRSSVWGGVVMSCPTCTCHLSPDQVLSCLCLCRVDRALIKLWPSTLSLIVEL